MEPIFEFYPAHRPKNFLAEIIRSRTACPLQIQINSLTCMSCHTPIFNYSEDAFHSYWSVPVTRLQAVFSLPAPSGACVTLGVIIAVLPPLHF
ncbi:hypothetical protein LOK49_LG14G01249 [Camellia lanceoleosa]|uniref:Uncharacterized protein n=1 Tax=Camellia lanceoleosa TaxID=1840588 RepID=A0ACC0FC85_9ERIC|nr:hypothetical protein LOK49_LG14G01249 [Camellia lanceoleosa]